MRQKSGKRDFCLPWDRLIHQATRKRINPNDPTMMTRSPQGKDIMDWSKANTQVLTCWIQPHAGSLNWKPEGLLADTSHILYCNMVVAPGSAVVVDIKEGDRIVGPDGITYRVVFVDNAAGVNHHYEILLSTTLPKGV